MADIDTNSFRCYLYFIKIAAAVTTYILFILYLIYLHFEHACWALDPSIKTPFVIKLSS